MTTMTYVPIGTSQPILWPAGSISSMNSALLRPVIAADTSSVSVPMITISADGIELSGPADLMSGLLDTKWLHPTLVGLVTAFRLPEGWNSYGGRRIQKRAVETMLRMLTAVLGPKAPPPAIVPTAQGGIQAEWHQNHIDLEIEVTPSGALEFFFRSQTEEREGMAGTGDIATIKNLTDRLVTR